jgi:hypothetical protein
MTKSASVTQAQFGRAIAAAKKAGLRIVGIRPDGTVIVYDGDGPIEDALRSVLGCETEARGRNPWDDVLDDELAAFEKAKSGGVKTDVPVMDERWRDEGWREQRLEKWKASVRRSPLGVLEKRALKALFGMKGQTPQRIKGAGPGTMDKLEVRGFARPVGEVKSGRYPTHEITAEGEAHWRTIADNDDI